MSVANDSDSSLIHATEPPRRHAPVTETGIVGWVRHNLFRTPLDALLTIVGGIVIYVAVTGLLTWAIKDANWFAITRNLSLFMLGPLQADAAAVNNVQIMTVVLVFAVGFSLAAWSRVGMRGWLVVAILAAIMLIVPRIIASTITLPTTILTAGNEGIVSGSLTETPVDEIAFIARAGETVEVSVAREPGASDVALTSIAAFTDRAADAVASAARERVAGLTRLDEIIALLDDPGLSSAERAALVSQQEALSALTDASVADRYAVNAVPVSVRILGGDLETVLAEGVLSPDSPPLIATIPGSGWYVIEKSVESESGLVLLETRGIYPHIERQINRAVLDVEGNPVLGASGQPRVITTAEYVRIVDDLRVPISPPRRDGIDMRRLAIVDHQYRGDRPLGDFLVLHVGPFLQRAGLALIPLFAVIFVGYVAGRGVDRFVPYRPPAAPWSRRAAFWMWTVMPIVIFLLVANTDLGRWGGLFLTFMLTVVGIVASFPIGVLLALGRRADGLPAIKYFCIAFIELVRGVPLITVLFLASLALPLVSPALSSVPQAVRAMVAITFFSAAYLAENVRGGLQSVPPGQTEAAKALGMNPVQVTVFITLPQALRAVIPALVGQFISLFKDTSLVAIVGLLDLTKNADNVVAQPEYIGLRQEAYIFIAIVYFVFSYAMGYISRKLELSGSGRAR